MKHQRIIRGNSTTVPSHGEVLGEYRTCAVTEKKSIGKSSEECVAASREFMMENKK